jgi:Pyruvate/2-oxoacid:ferredoxin oxidoreductase delta subunit
MFLGLIEPPDSEVFDPVEHIDLSLSTVTHETVVMNHALLNFNIAHWNEIRQTISRVPLSHSFWNVDLAMGDSIWDADSDASIVPQAPTIQLEIPMVPLDAWFDDTVASPKAECHVCHSAFPNFGSLLRHHQSDHGDALANLPDTSLDNSGHGLHCDARSDQDRADMEYWQKVDSRYRCEPCQKNFPDEQALRNHMHDEHGGELKEKCPFCPKKFRRKQGLRNHMVVEHGAKSKFQCEECGKYCPSNLRLQRHIQTDHGTWPCGECDEVFPSKALLKEHEVSHGRWNYVCECGNRFEKKCHLRSHQWRTGHGNAE